MKAKLQKLIGTAALGLALCSNSIPTWAGAVNHTDVIVSSSSSSSSAYARGTMVGARYSGDSLQFIGCVSAQADSSGSGPFVTCLATDKTGKSLVCSSTAAKFVVPVNAINDSSHIYFALAPGTTTCYRMSVTNGSDLLR